MTISKEKLYLWYVCLIGATCMMLNGYDSSSFNAVQGSDNFMDYFHNPSPGVIGSINTAYTVGGILSGFFISAQISDRFGRKWAMITGSFLIIISSLVAAFTPRDIGGFVASRAITGIGQGIALPAGPVYINEMAPAEIRGMLMSFWQIFFGIGAFLAYWINYACTKNADRLGDWDWRIVMLFQILAPTIIIVGLQFCPESPRWYMQNDRAEEAAKTLSRIRSDPGQVQMEIQEISAAIAYEKTTISGQWAPLWKDKTVRRRFLLAVGLNIGQQFTGQGSLTTYSTIIYKQVFIDNSEIQLINALNGTLGIIFTLNATWMADRWGRRVLLLIGAAGMGLAMIAAAATVTETPSGPGGVKERPVGIATVFLMFFFALFYKPSWGATVWIWTSEIFSMNVRAQAIAMASQSQAVSSTILQQIFPIFLDKKGFYAMYMFGGINVVLFTYVWFLIPETKGVALERMDTIFGGIDHSDKGNAILSHDFEEARVETNEKRKHSAEVV
ncbi:sugar transporter [Colletotrichum truncatum]|uniref:Sugar transporter n=1 Tax=Colletotrichum truncatum TaxID=5467 RepID=A0ACC3ZK52_COLTU|nr:sugar transporter [Colletotrichum truncatum]KAF6799880.1 sugar transporter [Colletotrichum truncatum]